MEQWKGSEPGNNFGTLLRPAEGEILGRLEFGPILGAAALEMAAVAKDYNPLYLFSGDRSDGRESRAVLHSLWLSGLVDCGIRRLVPGTMVVDLALEHDQPAHVGETLSFTATVISTEAGSTQINIGLEIKGRKGRTISRGTAVLVATGVACT